MTKLHRISGYARPFGLLATQKTLTGSWSYTLATGGTSGTDTRTTDSGWAAFSPNVFLPAGNMIIGKSDLAAEDQNEPIFFARISDNGADEGKIPITRVLCAFTLQFRKKSDASAVDILDGACDLTGHDGAIMTDTATHPYDGSTPGNKESSQTIDLFSGGTLFQESADGGTIYDAYRMQAAVTVDWGTPVRFDHKWADNGPSGLCIEFGHAGDTYEPTIRVAPSLLDHLYVLDFND